MTCDAICQERLFYSNVVISGIFMLCALAISLNQVFKHLKHFTNEFFQERIVAIILMVPFYALTSFLSNIWMDWSAYLVVIRDIYEAFFIYHFFTLLLAYLAYENNELRLGRVYQFLEHKTLLYHLFPFDKVLPPYRIQE
eukprot:TRINITY_DN4488_c0_g1_i5.p1 TRINITY_DN4488_c0_g1~~TRINITY_DN4488_c0_g1_i5.p1  ORF type:complete len:140 (+),score=11.95 TRINITY_DN4488_c0_g1_i5:149-568(+)